MTGLLGLDNEFERVLRILRTEQSNFSTGNILRGRIIENSKNGIAALDENFSADCSPLLRESYKFFQDLEGLDFSGDKKSEILGSAGKEMIEFQVVSLCLPFIFRGGEAPSGGLLGKVFPVKPQIRFAGFANAVGELGKIVKRHLATQSHWSREQRIEIRRRFVQIAAEIYKDLKRFMGVNLPKKLLDNGTVRHYEGTFESRLSNIAEIIAEHETVLANLMDAMSS